MGKRQRLLLTMTLILGTPAVVMAQQTATTDTQSQRTAEAADREDKGEWGWIGLLGLAGLAGLMRRDRDTVRTTSRGV